MHLYDLHLEVVPLVLNLSHFNLELEILAPYLPEDRVLDPHVPQLMLRPGKFPLQAPDAFLQPVIIPPQRYLILQQFRNLTSKLPHLLACLIVKPPNSFYLVSQRHELCLLFIQNGLEVGELLSTGKLLLCAGLAGGLLLGER